jgi:putative endonuclease
MTNDLTRRVREHRDGSIQGFTKKYVCTRLVYFESHEFIWDAIEREKEVKKWTRAQKENLVREFNPEWKDLFDQIENE